MIELDARRLLCPMPVIKTQEKIKSLNKGEHLQVICTDPGALQDIPAWCRIHGHQVIESREQDDEILLTLQVGE